MLTFIRRLIPRRIFNAFAPAYHYLWALLGALIYRFPSRKITVVAVTGTKGKTSVTELLAAMLEASGYTVAVSNTVRFKIGDLSERNLYKMSMPGRMFIQRFLRRAVAKGCSYAVLEMTSEGAKQFRHRFIDMDAVVFTNLSPEHIESHGSYEKYREAKLSIARALATSRKSRTLIVANADEPEGSRFLAVKATERQAYSLRDIEPYEIKKEGASFTFEGRAVSSPLSGRFNLYNILAAAATARRLGVSADTIARVASTFAGIPGRLEHIDEGQDFTVVVDYAHTADSLEKVYEVFQHAPKICVLGGTGGGRDTGKRRVMGEIANVHCSEIILTDEDPYDEDPMRIIAHIKEGIKKPARVIMDRREAIKTALAMATTGDVVLITGKGTDPYIMGPRGTKTPWSDARVAREELKTLVSAKQ